MISRDPVSAASETYDLIVVGGGIYGVALTLEASRRGHRVLLLERSDFGAETSWNSLRIVHGGLRYLQSLDLPRFRTSVAERHWFLEEFPDQVVPLPCLMPLYNRGARRTGVLRVALKLNDLLSANRNRGLDADRQLPAGSVIGAEQTLEIFPQARPQGLKGGALWYDGIMPDSQLLIMEMLQWAVANQSVVLNYFAAENLQVKEGGVNALTATDLGSGSIYEFHAPVVVNAAGPWCREVASRFDQDHPELFCHSIALNLLIDRPSLSEAGVAVKGEPAGSRTYFLVPWHGKVHAGTYHAPLADANVDKNLLNSLVASMLRDLNVAIPDLKLTTDEILRVQWGLLPARRQGTEALAVRELIVSHASSGGPRGLYSVSGVKFTTARDVAEKVVRRLEDDGQIRSRPYTEICRPEPIERVPTKEFLALLKSSPQRATEIARDLIESGAVLRLEDLLLRRTGWGVEPDIERLLTRQLTTLLGWTDRVPRIRS